MTWQYTPYIIPLLIAAAATALLTIYAWQRRNTTGGTAFAFLMLAVTIWSVAYAFELAGADLSTKIFWAKVKYIGIVSVPVAWLAFALQFTHQAAWLTPRNLILLAIIPALTLVFMWTNEAHQLIWIQPHLNAGSSFLTIGKDYGGWFWVFLIYTYILLGVGSVLLIRMLIRSPRLYRWQTNLLLLGVLVPWIVNIISVFNLSPVPNLDLTPFAFTLTGIAFGWAFSHYKLLNVVPVARRATVDNMPDGMVVTDTQNRVVDLNPAAQHIVGHSFEEAIGKTDTEIFSNLPDLTGHLRQTTPTRTEIVVTHGDIAHYFGVRVTPLFTKQNQFSGQLIVLRDITQRKQAETERERLLAQEQEQRLQAEILREVTLVLASQTNLKTILNEVLHQTHRVVPYETAHIMLLEDDQLRIAAWQGYKAFGSQKFMSDLEQPLADLPLDTKVVETQQAVVIPDTTKEPRWVVQEETAWVKSHLVAPLALQDKVLGLLRLDSNIPNQFSEDDIKYLTPLANAAAIGMENVRLLTVEKQRAEELASLIAAAAAISASLDIEQVLQIVAVQMTRLLEVQACTISQWNETAGILNLWAEHIPSNWGLTPKWYKTIDLADHPAITTVLRKAHPVQLQVNDPNIDSAIRHFMEDAGVLSMLIIPLAVQSRTIGMAELMDGEQVRIFSKRELALIQMLANQAAIAIENAQLLTAEHQRAEQLAVARDQALEASRVKSELLGRVSHELRTPLGVILGYTEMLHASVYGDISSEQRETVQKIIDSTVGLTDRVNDLLDQAQLEANNLKINNSDFAPKDLVEYIQTAQGMELKAKSLQLIYKIDDNVPATITGDQKLLRKVLMNLVSNAVKFTNEGHIEVYIYLPNEAHWAVKVTDTGVGIPLEVQSQIFEPFWQLDGSSTRKYGGTGLGLSIVKQLVALMQGRIYLESKDGRGSAFTILLPLLPIQEQELVH